MDITTIQAIMAIFGTIFSVIVLWRGFKKMDSVKEDVLDEFQGFVEKGMAFYVQEKTDLIESFPKLIAGALHAPVMSQLGKMSGISRQLKGLEGDLMADGISEYTGNPALGPLVAKYAQKYPIVAQMIPMFMQGKGQVPGNSHGHEGAGYG